MKTEVLGITLRDKNERMDSNTNKNRRYIDNCSKIKMKMDRIYDQNGH